jgi:HAT1-interacting factor 1
VSRSWPSTTEKFDQAITDYTVALNLKNRLLPLHHRQIAEAHWKLSMVLDLTSGRLGDAVQHVERAIASVDARLQVLRDGVQGTLSAPIAESSKGKGKATVVGIQIGDPITALSKDEMASEIKEFEDLKAELELKAGVASRTGDGLFNLNVAFA